MIECAAGFIKDFCLIQFSRRLLSPIHVFIGYINV